MEIDLSSVQEAHISPALKPHGKGAHHQSR